MTCLLSCITFRAEFTTFEYKQNKNPPYNTYRNQKKKIIHTNRTNTKYELTNTETSSESNYRIIIEFYSGRLAVRLRINTSSDTFELIAPPRASIEMQRCISMIDSSAKLARFLFV